MAAARGARGFGHPPNPYLIELSGGRRGSLMRSSKLHSVPLRIDDSLNPQTELIPNFRLDLRSDGRRSTIQVTGSPLLIVNIRLSIAAPSARPNRSPPLTPIQTEVRSDTAWRHTHDPSRCGSPHHSAATRVRQTRRLEMRAGGVQLSEHQPSPVARR